MSNDDSNSNSRGDEDDADNYTFDCITAPYGRSCVSVDRMVRTSLLLLCYYINLVIRINHGIPLTFSFFSFSLLKNIEMRGRVDDLNQQQEKREIVSYIHSILVTILISSLESTMASISHLRVVCLFLLLLTFKESSQENV